MGVTDELDRLFQGHRSRERNADWDALKRRLTYGHSVAGTVVAKYHFGAWVDLGVGFPALLTITVIAGLTPERYRAGDWCPIGSEVRAFVGGFDTTLIRSGSGRCRSARVAPDLAPRRTRITT
jgi:hypothetical protein